MTLLTIRNHKRYATRSSVALRRDQRKTARGLMIELSPHGARISNLGRAKFKPGDAVTIVAPDDREISGSIRWAHDGLAGIQFEPALSLPEMRELLDISRKEQTADWPRFGT